MSEPIKKARVISDHDLKLAYGGDADSSASASREVRRIRIWGKHERERLKKTVGNENV